MSMRKRYASGLSWSQLIAGQINASSILTADRFVNQKPTDLSFQKGLRITPVTIIIREKPRSVIQVKKKFPKDDPISQATEELSSRFDH